MGLMTTVSKVYLFTQALMILALGSVLWLGLLPAFLTGFFVYFVLEFGSRLLKRIGVIPATAKMILLVIITLLLLSSFVLGILAMISFMSSGNESLVVLLQRIADIVSVARTYLPASIQEYLPNNVQEWQHTFSGWLRNNAGELSLFGKDVGLFLVHTIFGMIIGGLVAISPPAASDRILSNALTGRITALGNAFRCIVFSQVKISAINTVLTALFLAVVMPLTGNALPFLKTLVALTFIVGLLPIVGNLISNTVIFLIALSVSPLAAIESIVFLVLIHKLEYFVNAHIIGIQIKARAWELLLAMLIMESAFGMPGLIAAPIYYAYLKNELTSQKLI